MSQNEDTQDTICFVNLTEPTKEEILKWPDEFIFFVKRHGRGYTISPVEKQLEDLLYAQGGMGSGWKRVIFPSEEVEEGLPMEDEPPRDLDEGTGEGDPYPYDVEWEELPSPTLAVDTITLQAGEVLADGYVLTQPLAVEVWCGKKKRWFAIEIGKHQWVPIEVGKHAYGGPTEQAAIDRFKASIVKRMTFLIEHLENLTPDLQEELHNEQEEVHAWQAVLALPKSEEEQH